MKRMDARTLSPKAQQDLRERVAFAICRQDMAVVAAAQTFGVTRQSAARWAELAREGGTRALAARRRGPRPAPRLDSRDEKAIKRAIRNDCPDQLLLPFALWSREAVVALIRQRTGQVVSVWTAGRYLKRWGYTPQKPIRRAYERDEAQVKAWLKEEYPAIQAQAKRENARIFWGDEMGLRSDDALGRGYSPRGQTPVTQATGRRFGCSMISAISNLGELRFMVFKERFTAKVFIEFLSRLLRTRPERAIFLIVDGHPVHRARKVRAWLSADAKRSQQLKLFFLPGYSPELNPDECVNQDTKQAMRRQRPRNQQEMITNVRGHLKRRQKEPEVVKRFFQEAHVRYAA
jgi:transposase